MARGSGSEQALVNNAAGTLEGSASGLYGSAAGGFNAQLAHPGYTPAQINTQRDAALTPIAAQTASAQTTLADRAARTRNSAGLVAGQDQAARTGAGLSSQASYGVEAGADKTALQQQDEALKGLSGLYSSTLENATGLYGIGQKANASRTGGGFNLNLGKLGSFGGSSS